MRIKDFELSDWSNRTSERFAHKGLKLRGSLNNIDQENVIVIYDYTNKVFVQAFGLLNFLNVFLVKIKANSIEEAKKEVDNILTAFNKFPSFI